MVSAQPALVPNISTPPLGVVCLWTEQGGVILGAGAGAGRHVGGLGLPPPHSWEHEPRALLCPSSQLQSPCPIPMPPYPPLLPDKPQRSVNQGTSQSSPNAQPSPC